MRSVSLRRSKLSLEAFSLSHISIVLNIFRPASSRQLSQHAIPNPLHEPIITERLNWQKHCHGGIHVVDDNGATVAEKHRCQGFPRVGAWRQAAKNARPASSQLAGIVWQLGRLCKISAPIDWSKPRSWRAKIPKAPSSTKGAAHGSAAIRQCVTNDAFFGYFGEIGVKARLLIPRAPIFRKDLTHTPPLCLPFAPQTPWQAKAGAGEGFRQDSRLQLLEKSFLSSLIQKRSFLKAAKPDCLSEKHLHVHGTINPFQVATLCRVNYFINCQLIYKSMAGELLP
jgi:hypothetical protein